MKAGVFGVLLVGVVSILAVAVGFTVVPLAPGREHQDAARRLGAGLLCSFTLGPPMAMKFLEWQPSILEHWRKILGAGNALWAYLAAATPFIAFAALAGFWLVAAWMRYFTKRADKDIGELADELKGRAGP